MNFNFLFKQNLTDNRLMQESPDWWRADWKYITDTNPDSLTPTVLDSDKANQSVQETPSPFANYTFKLNGDDLRWKYSLNKSAAWNRKDLKEYLESKSLGTKADATGLIGEYLNTLDPEDLNSKDSKWLRSREKMYGYTTDAQGNRDYYKNPGNKWSIIGSILGGMFLGPTGAMMGYYAGKQNPPKDGISGFYTSDTQDSKLAPINIADYSNVLNGSTVNNNTWVKDDYTYFIDNNQLRYVTPRYGMFSSGIVNPKGEMTWDTMGRYNNGKFTPIKGAQYQGIQYNYNPTTGKFSGITPEGVESILQHSDTNSQNVYTVNNQNVTKDLHWYKKGGIMNKFDIGGSVQSAQQQQDQEKLILAATFGIIGYTKSQQGSDIDFESAITQVMQIAQTEPETIQALLQNEKFIQDGAKSVESNNPELYKKLQQPGAITAILSEISKKNPVDKKLINKTGQKKKAMKGTKLNYIKELKGICPEGYEITYQAAGGHLCPVCKKKVEEAKCGKKMKTKKHESGGISPHMNKIKSALKSNN